MHTFVKVKLRDDNNFNEHEGALTEDELDWLQSGVTIEMPPRAGKKKKSRHWVWREKKLQNMLVGNAVKSKRSHTALSHCSSRSGLLRNRTWHTSRRLPHAANPRTHDHYLAAKDLKQPGELGHLGGDGLGSTLNRQIEQRFMKRMSTRMAPRTSGCPTRGRKLLPFLVINTVRSFAYGDIGMTPSATDHATASPSTLMTVVVLSIFAAGIYMVLKKSAPSLYALTASPHIGMSRIIAAGPTCWCALAMVARSTY